MKNTIRMAGLLVSGLAAFSVSQTKADVTYLIGDGGLEGGFNVVIDGSSLNNVLAGGIEITQDPLGNNKSLPSSYDTVCTDILGTLYLGSKYTYTDPVEFSGESGIKPTWGAGNQASTPGHIIIPANAMAAIQNAAYIYYNNFGLLQTGSTSQKAGLQLAVWSALYNTDTTKANDGLGDVTSSAGRFYASAGDSAALAAADAMLTTGGSGYAAPAGGFMGNYNYTGFLLFPDPNNTQGNSDGEAVQELLIAIPEPSSVWAGLLVLLPLGMVLHRARKN